MRFLGLLALTTAFTLPILADEDYEEGVAISPADIPTQCIVLCAPIIQVANGCQAKAAPAKPEEMDDKRRYPHSWMRREDDSEEDEMPMAMTADSCICNNATVNINTAGPVCDSCIRQNGATTKAVMKLIANCKLPAASALALTPIPTPTASSSAASRSTVTSVVIVTAAPTSSSPTVTTPVVVQPIIVSAVPATSSVSADDFVDSKAVASEAGRGISVSTLGIISGYRGYVAVVSLVMIVIVGM
ncbi:hypothetical protein BGZ60DRAFT_535073 [Tricladium varicosporioides]|nr:hypothetical protein BGZ60DRAFT_535073 [Hymenoscyphus varicosporioides]